MPKKQSWRGVLGHDAVSDHHEDRSEPGAQPDDVVVRFRTVKSNVMGRIVRLGPAVNAILNRHQYPPKVAEALAQALALVTMLGTSLKGDGAVLTLQAKSDGLISLLVADYTITGALRGYATVRDELLGDETAGLFGSGSLALTIDPGKGLNRYQGVVALEGQTLADAAHTYFRQSEQLPTFVRLAVAQHFDGGGSDDGAESRDAQSKWSWRAGGLMIQHLSREGGSDVAADELAQTLAPDPETEPPPIGEDDDDWNRARILASTVEDHELLDPNLDPERLLFRLFHEEGVVAFPRTPAHDTCRCSRDRVLSVLKSIESTELHALSEEDGMISVTCEFCTTRYGFDPSNLDAVPDDNA